MTERLWQRRLTDAEMDGLRESVVSADSPIDAVGAAIEGVLHIGLAEAKGSSFAAEDSIDPREFAVPSDQWSEICEWLVGFSASQQTGANLLMTWLNIGPSAFEEEQ